MSITRDAILGSPNHYLHSFDGSDAVFVPMDRGAFHRSIFLDRRIMPAAGGSMRIPVSALVEPSGQRPDTHWIFHLGHCGSTLLARALDRLDTNLVLREPMALRQVAIDRDEARLSLVKTLLGRRYLADRPTIVKANVPVNFILPSLVKREARAIFLFSSLRHWMLAILRSAEHRLWITRVTEHLSTHYRTNAQTDAERAAALWSAQMTAFAVAMERLPNAACVDSEEFFARPNLALAAAAAHLEVPMNAEAINEVVEGPLFGTHAKNPALVFDNVARIARRASLESTLAPELAAAELWLKNNGGVPDLCRALIAKNTSRLSV